MLAPIGLTVYGRIEHTRQAIAALKANPLAKESALYIFSDAPAQGDEEKVAQMREYLRTIDGFKETNIIERSENSRINNNRGGQKYLLEKYGKMIWMAEDVITAPGFLRFMNDALEFYKDDPRIGSISAYCPPIAIPSSYTKDFFALTAMNPWGFGLWRHYYKIDTPIAPLEFAGLLKDKKRLQQLESSVGEAAVQYMRMDYEGKINAGDMRCIFWQFIDNKLTIYPRKSLVNNMGQDGSGVHMGVTNKWNVPELWDKVDGFEFADAVEVDADILKIHNSFYKTNKAKIRLIETLDRMGIYRHLRPMARAIRNRFGS